MKRIKISKNLMIKVMYAFLLLSSVLMITSYTTGIVISGGAINNDNANK
jgi:hypothetical protein